MGVLPATKRPRSLHVAEPPPLDVARMHETPAYSERTNVYPHRPAVAVANPPGAFDPLHLLPRGRQPLERPGLGMPTKQLLRRCLDPGTSHEHFRPRHIFQAVLCAHSALEPGSESCHRRDAARHRENRGREPIGEPQIASAKERSSGRANESSISLLAHWENPQP